MKKTSEPGIGRELPVGLRRYLLLTAALTGAAIMIIEILGAKMLAPYIGTSHFVWTAQIAVTLVALATGYAAGGRLADRSPRLRWMYGAVFLAAGWLGLAVFLTEPLAYGCLRFRLALGSLLAAAGLFFVPLALLATVPPFLVRLMTRALADVGTSVGRLSAISTGGSFLGTVLIGYVLIPLLPNSLTMVGTAGVLLLVALIYFVVWEPQQRVSAVTVALLCAVPGFLGAIRPTLEQPEGLKEAFRGNSNFGLLQVVEDPSNGRRYYLNDLLTQNSYLPARHQSGALFTYLLHGLAHRYTAETRRVLCIGMGVGIVPMQFAAEGSEVDVVEINPAVVPVARQYFGFDPTKLRLTIGDGRQFLATSTNQYDTIVLDAFLGESPPAHLMTREALTAMKARLRPGGTLVMNTFGEFTHGKDFFLASLDKTLRTVFSAVTIHASGNGNVFFVAADRPALQPLRAPVMDQVPAELRSAVEAAFAGNPTTEPAHGLVLTDDFNPVDYRDAANREDLRRRLAMASRSN